jgi:hypothetical protein
MGDPTNSQEFSGNPETSDLVQLCREFNRLGVKYIVLGGFAIQQHGFQRATGDIDFLIDTDPANEAATFKALEILADQAVLELKPGEVSAYSVVRVCDEIVVDLMARACGIDYAGAKDDTTIIDVGGVPIPFASPSLLWRTKQTFREKDKIDLIFLQRLFTERGEAPPP